MNENPLSAHHEPGEVVWATVFNPFENDSSKGKQRPAVLIYRVGGHWKIMGLTSKPHFHDGRSRIPVPNPQAVGLPGPGHLWGNRTTQISAMDVGDHLGWADLNLAGLIIGYAGLYGRVARDLWAAAERHHAFPPRVA